MMASGLDNVKMYYASMIALHWFAAILSGNKSRAAYMQYLWTVLIKKSA